MFRAVLTAAALALSLAGCSTVQTSGATAQLATIAATDRIQLKVRTGDDQLDRTVFELVYQQFSQVMPLKETGPFTGALEITFSSASQNGFMGTSTTFVSGSGSSQGWYTGNSYSGTSSSSVSGSTFSSGTILQWQNSTMLAVLRGAEGDRIWSGDYSYKGGWEMSGWVVNTPEEAARLVAKRLKERFVADSQR